MPFTGNENHWISLEEAAKLTRNYREAAGSGAILGGFFGKNAILDILNQSGCVGLRIYYGQSDDDKSRFVLTGVNSDEDDLYEGHLAEISIDCPPHCPKANPLTS
jgi:hypothetical protein